MERIGEELELSLLFTYNRSSDLLTMVLPSRAGAAVDGTAILPFSKEDGLPSCLSIALFVDCDEEGEIKGNLLGLEIPFFRASFPDMSSPLHAKLRSAVPFQMVEPSVIAFDPENTNLELIDSALVKNDESVVIFAFLPQILDRLYVSLCKTLAKLDATSGAPEEQDVSDGPIQAKLRQVC